MTVVEHALHVLRDAIGGGEFRVGARLPPERQLAARLGIGRSSLRKALDEMERCGEVRRHVGRGTFVEGVGASGIAGLETTLRLDPPPSPTDVMELRLMIEPQIASLAALRANAPSIARLREMTGDLERAREWTDWERLDSRLHKAVAETCRNPLLVSVLETLNVIRGQREWGELRSMTLNPERQRLYSMQHRVLVEAIGAHNPVAAGRAMRAHLGAVRDAMIAGPDGPAENAGDADSSFFADPNFLGAINAI